MPELKKRSARRAMARRSISALVLILSVFLGTATAAAGEQGKISEVAGQVEIGRGEPPAFAKALVGDLVNPGDMVRTGHGGRVELQLAEGSVRLYENSLLRIPAQPDVNHQVELQQGRSIFDVIKGSVRDRFEVRTPEVVVSVKGTRFEVNLLGELAEVAVFRGTVGVRAPDAARELETLVREGFAAIGASDVSFELDLSPRVDPWDSWAELDSSRESAMNRGRTERGLRMREAAQSAARRSSAKELLGIATERNPELARKIEAMRKQRLAKARSEGAVAKESGAREVPASLADYSREVKSRDLDGKREAMAHRKRNIAKHHMADDMGALRAAQQIKGSQGNFRKIKSLTQDNFSTGSVQTIKDPGGASQNGSWDPTPDVTMLDMASLEAEISYQELINIWYTAVGQLQNTDPALFTTTNLSNYETALKDKLVQNGLSDAAALTISQWIVAKVQQ